MSERDVIAELDFWLDAATTRDAVIETASVRRACEAIRDLQRRLAVFVDNHQAWRASVRLEALEQAAHECEQLSRRRFHVSDHHSRHAAHECVRVIRALKRDKP